MNRANFHLLVFVMIVSWLLGCTAANERRVGPWESSSSDPEDTDTETASESHTDSDADADEILPDCSSCPALGTDLEHLRCAVDLCDDAVFIGQEYASATCKNEKAVTSSRAAVRRFGSDSNDLKPLYPEQDGSYALMATGKAVPSSPLDAYDHNSTLCSSLLQPHGPSIPDPYAPSEHPSFDVVEWKLRLVAPPQADGIRIHYVFFSVEYDEYVGREFNDKFYVLLNGPQTTGGKDQIINFTSCRPNIAKPDFLCPAGQLGCEEGQGYCYVAVNSALSECCWYDGCTTASSNTDISGTGFECGTEATDYIGNYSMGFTYGSSTGWLVTTWPVKPGEELTLTFHLHDTADSFLDSEVIIDKVVFVNNATAGTVPVM